MSQKHFLEAINNPEYEKVSTEKTYTHYYASRDKNACHKKRYSRDGIEKAVVHFTAFQYLTDENIKKIARALYSLQDTNPNAEEIKKQQRIIEEESRKINNLFNAIEQGLQSSEVYTRIKQAEERQANAETEISKLKLANNPSRTKEEYIDDLKKVREKMTEFVNNGEIPENVIKRFCDIFIDKVYIYERNDGGKPCIKIIYDVDETSGLLNFDNSDVEICSTIDSLGSPKKRDGFQPSLFFSRGTSFYLFLYQWKRYCCAIPIVPLQHFGMPFG